MRYISQRERQQHEEKRSPDGRPLKKRTILSKKPGHCKLSRYIHLNPVKAGMVSSLEEHRWSSYRYYAGKDKRPDFLTTSFILGYFDSDEAMAMKRYAAFVEEVIGTEYENPLSETIASTILGSSEFIDKISVLLSAQKTSDRDLPALGKLSKRPTIQSISDTITSLIPDDPALAKKIGIHLSRKLTGGRLKEIGKFYGMTDTAVTQTCKRLLLKVASDKSLGRLLAKAEKQARMANGKR